MKFSKSIFALFIKLLTIIYNAIYSAIEEYDAIEHSGFMAFITLLAFFPFIVFLLAAASFIDQSALGSYFISFIFAYMPNDVALALQPRVDEIIGMPTSGLLTLSMINALWTSSSAIEGIRTILNRIYRVHTPPSYLWRRFLSVLQFILFTFTIILVMSFLVLVPVLINNFFVQFNLLHNLGVFILLTNLAAVIFYFVPNHVNISYYKVLPGAVFVGLSWTLASKTLSYYLLNTQQMTFIYGGLQNIIVTLIFFFMLNLLLIIGANFNMHLHYAYAQQNSPPTS